MKEETLKMLQDAEDSFKCNGIANYDWQEHEERVRSLKPELEQYLNLSLWLEDGVQDASFIAGLYSEDRVICIHFSVWGNFFTIWDESINQPLSSDDFKPIISLIEKVGFIHVSYNDLFEKYDGQDARFMKENWSYCREGVMKKERASWWDRYFDYT